MSEEVKLSDKEKAAIEALQSVAKIWPASLSIGQDIDSKWCTIWKKASLGADSVGLVKIRNEDSWE